MADVRAAQQGAGMLTATEARRGPLSARSEVVIVGGMALAVLALHLATNGLYDFHRDSLYYMDSARHPAWGYVDYPPITPTIARFSLWLFGPSVWGLRLWPSLAGGLMVALTALIARELGGGRAARLLAALGAATSLVLLGANWLFQTVTFDEVVWLACLCITARLLRTGDRRLWLALGAAVGIGLETKYTVIGLVLGLAAGILATQMRRALLTPWPWFGLALAFVVFLPNLVWQVGNDWPSLQFTFNHKSAQSLDFSPVTFLVQQLVLIGPVAIPLWLTGLWWLLRSPARRLLGVAALFTFLIYMFTGKSYYVGPLHPFLIACGACALEEWTPTRAQRLRRLVAAALIVQALVLLPLALPVLPEAQMARSPLAQVRTDFAATVGWHDLVAQVATVYRGLPAGERSRAVILANNYGEAGAINTYGRPEGLPTAYSGELSYYYWKPSAMPGPVVAIGFDLAFLRTLFDSCDEVATITNSYGLHNEEYGLPIAVCRQPKFPLGELWPRLKAFQ